MTSTPTLDPAARLAELVGGLGEQLRELADLSGRGRGARCRPVEQPIW